ncbi:MAG TPA: hypothetical protein PK082_01640 [Phycisphaerae bacterium]|nr:hypothetical protein [Phycisphaerae bacterium]
MTTLKKPVSRETAARQFERGADRPIIVSIEPPGTLGFRLKGTRRTYRLPVATCFLLAVRSDSNPGRRMS